MITCSQYSEFDIFLDLFKELKMISAKETREDGYFYSDIAPIKHDAQPEFDKNGKYIDRCDPNHPINQPLPCSDTIPFISKNVEFNLKLDNAKNPQGHYQFLQLKVYGLFYGKNELYGVSFNLKVLEQKKKDLECLYQLAVAYLKDCNEARTRIEQQLTKNLEKETVYNRESTTRYYSEYHSELSKLKKKEDKNLAWSNLQIKEVNIL